jgi:hypothetical protein
LRLIINPSEFGIVIVDFSSLGKTGLGLVDMLNCVKDISI